MEIKNLTAQIKTQNKQRIVRWMLQKTQLIKIHSKNFLKAWGRKKKKKRTKSWTLREKTNSKNKERTSLVVQWLIPHAPNVGGPGLIPGQGTSGEGNAPHSSTLAWKIPWTEEPGGLQSMGSLRVGHDWAISLSLFTFMCWRRKWQPTPVFLPWESLGWRSLVGCHLWGRTESDATEAT